jgi:hypothetical protein
VGDEESGHKAQPYRQDQDPVRLASHHLIRRLRANPGSCFQFRGADLEQILPIPNDCFDVVQELLDIRLVSIAAGHTENSHHLIPNSSRVFPHTAKKKFSN